MNVLTIQDIQKLSGEGIQMLLRQAKRYQFAAEQDLNPLIAILHNSYAVARVDAIQSLVTVEEIKKATGEDIRKIRKRILKFQDKLQAQAEKIVKRVLKGADIPIHEIQQLLLSQEGPKMLP